MDTLYFRFTADGVFEGFGLDLGGFGSCSVVAAMEPEPGEDASQECVINEEGRARTP